MSVQAGLCRTLSETPKTGFFVSRLNYLKVHDFNTNHRKITKVNFHVQKVVSLDLLALDTNINGLE